jgi:hypothetical protein
MSIIKKILPYSINYEENTLKYGDGYCIFPIINHKNRENTLNLGTFLNFKPDEYIFLEIKIQYNYSLSVNGWSSSELRCYMTNYTKYINIDVYINSLSGNKVYSRGSFLYLYENYKMSDDNIQKIQKLYGSTIYFPIPSNTSISSEEIYKKQKEIFMYIDKPLYIKEKEEQERQIKEEEDKKRQIKEKQDLIHKIKNNTLIKSCYKNLCHHSFRDDKEIAKLCIDRGILKNYIDLSDELRKDKEIVKLCIDKEILKNYDDLSDELQKDTEFLKLYIEKKILKGYNDFNDKLKKNKDFAILCIENNFLNDYVDLYFELQRDKEIVILCIEKEILKDYNDLDVMLKKDKEIKFLYKEKDKEIEDRYRKKYQKKNKSKISKICDIHLDILICVFLINFCNCAYLTFKFLQF